MGRKGVPEEDKRLIRQIYAEDPRHGAKQVRGEFIRRTKRLWSLRVVQEIIQPLRGNLPLPQEEPLWQPSLGWGQASSEEMEFLLTLDLISLLLEGGHLTQREARWGRCLHKLLDGMDPYQQLALIRAYAARERAADALGVSPPLTQELDAYLQWRPWRSADAAYLYGVAVETGLIPPLPGWEELAQELDLARPGSDLSDVLALLVRIFPGASLDSALEGQLDRIPKPRISWGNFTEELRALGADGRTLAEASIRWLALVKAAGSKPMSENERLAARKGILEQMKQHIKQRREKARPHPATGSGHEDSELRG